MVYVIEVRRCGSTIPCRQLPDASRPPRTSAAGSHLGNRNEIISHVDIDIFYIYFFFIYPHARQANTLQKGKIVCVSVCDSECACTSA